MQEAKSCIVFLLSNLEKKISKQVLIEENESLHESEHSSFNLSDDGSHLDSMTSSSVLTDKSSSNSLSEVEILNSSTPSIYDENEPYWKTIFEWDLSFFPTVKSLVDEGLIIPSDFVPSIKNQLELILEK